MIRFNANLFRIAFAAVSKEETRYYMNGVYVEPHAVKGVTLTATDGHRLLSIHDESGFADESAIIRLTDLKVCKPGRCERRDVVIYTGENDANICSVIAEEDNGNETLTDTPIAKAFGVKIDGCFPDYRRCVPSDPTSEGDIPSFNGTYVGDFGKIGNELAAHFNNQKSAAMRVSGADAGSPALVTWTATDPPFGVLMPMRSTAATSLPAWFNARPTKFAQAAE